MRASGWACAQGRAAHGEWHTSHGAPRRQGDDEEERNASHASPVPEKLRREETCVP